MSTRANNTIDFKNIIYDDTNIDTDWDVEVLDTATRVKDATETTALKTALGSGSVAIYDKLSDLLGSGVSPATVGDPPDVPVARYASTFQYAPAITAATVVLAFRMPLVQNICELSLIDDGTNELSQAAKNLRFYISGRSDKVYSEITEWVKTFDTGMISPIYDDAAQDNLLGDDHASDENGFVNDDDLVRYPSSINTLVGRSPDCKHTRFFKSRAAWFKIEIDMVDTKTLALLMAGLHKYSGLSTAVPAIDIVWPPNNEVYLPTQTVYMTAKVSDADGDNCHFRFDLFKESLPNPTSLMDLDEDDLQVATFDSNALNLDGTPNINYKREYFSLLNQGVSSRNTVHLKAKRSATKVLIIPQLADGVSVASDFNLEDVLVYRVGTDTPYYTDSVDNLVALEKVSALTVNTDGADGKQKAWLINIGSEQEIIKFEFVHTAAGTNVVDFKLRFSNSTVGGMEDPAVGWVEADKETAWVADIQYCWPYDVDDNTDGYLYVAGDDDSNPENNGKEGYATQTGKWRTVPAFSGLILRKSASGAGNRASDVTTGGDSPIQTESLDEDKQVFVRISLPDPYRTQERYYFKPGVWDSQVQNI